MGNNNKSISLPSTKYTKQVNSGFSYNQGSFTGGFRNDCTGFVSDVLRTNGYKVPADFNTDDIKKWRDSSNDYFGKVIPASGSKLTVACCPVVNCYN